MSCCCLVLFLLLCTALHVLAVIVSASQQGCSDWSCADLSKVFVSPPEQLEGAHICLMLLSLSVGVSLIDSFKFIDLLLEDILKGSLGY